MELQQLFDTAVKRLKAEACDFALCGGVLASVYREEPRLTADIDFALCATSGSSSTLAERIIRDCKLSPTPVREGALSNKPRTNKKQTSVVVVIGRSKTDKDAPGLDFLLPANPWVAQALKRARLNELEFTCGKVPSIPPEDLIIAKCFALENSKRYHQHLDDILSVLRAGHSLDLDYLAGEFDRHRLHFPLEVEAKLPKPLQAASKRIRCGKRAK